MGLRIDLRIRDEETRRQGEDKSNTTSAIKKAGLPSTISLSMAYISVITRKVGSFFRSFEYDIINLKVAVREMGRHTDRMNMTENKIEIQ